MIDGTDRAVTGDSEIHVRRVVIQSLVTLLALRQGFQCLFALGDVSRNTARPGNDSVFADDWKLGYVKRSITELGRYDEFTFAGLSGSENVLLKLPISMRKLGWQYVLNRFPAKLGHVFAGQGFPFPVDSGDIALRNLSS